MELGATRIQQVTTVTERANSILIAHDNTTTALDRVLLEKMIEISTQLVEVDRIKEFL